MFPLALSPRALTITLLIVSAAFAYQTFSLMKLSAALASSDLTFGGGGSPAVNFSSDGSAPSMVGGC